MCKEVFKHSMCRELYLSDFVHLLMQWVTLKLLKHKDSSTIHMQGEIMHSVNTEKHAWSINLRAFTLHKELRLVDFAHIVMQWLTLRLAR